MTNFDKMLEAAKKKEANRIHVKSLTQKSYTWIFAIDPNCSETDKSHNCSGTCLLNTQNKMLWVNRYTFPQVIEAFHNAFKSGINNDLLILVEAGWLNKGNWHLHAADTVRTASKKGRDIGLNHQTGRLIVEMAEAMHLDVELIKPLDKHGSSYNRKLSAEDLKAAIPNLPKGTNEDERDAIQLAWTRAGFPLYPDPKAQLAALLGKEAQNV